VKQLILIKSTSQKWTTRGNNINGTNYHIILKTFADTSKIKIDNLCINNHKISDFHLSVLGKSNTCYNYVSGDSIIISVNVVSNEKDKLQYCNCCKNTSTCIYYSFKNKKHTLCVDSMKVLPGI